jgi:hypothetical protein
MMRNRGMLSQMPVIDAKLGIPGMHTTTGGFPEIDLFSSVGLYLAVSSRPAHLRRARGGRRQPGHRVATLPDRATPHRDQRPLAGRGACVPLSQFSYL